MTLPDFALGMPDFEKIRWAPKVSQAAIWRLYQSDARGIVDEELVEEVGGSLYDRCRSVILVSTGSVECPRCGHVFTIGWPAEQANDLAICPADGCSWQTSGRQYHDSWRHRDLIGTNALPALEMFVEQYRHTTSPPVRMVLIDRLIHSFHQSLKADTPHRSVANNLIEGNHAQVVALLDRLTYGEASTPGLAERYARWHETMRDMQRYRRSE